MPSFASVWRTERGDCSTSRTISSFSDAVYLMRRPPHPPSRFFEQTVLQGELGHDPLQGRGFAAQVLALIRGGPPRRTAGQPLLARLEELLRPAVIEVLDNSLAPAQLRDAVLATQPLQHNADLVFGGKMPPRRPAYVSNHLLRRLS